MRTTAVKKTRIEVTDALAELGLDEQTLVDAILQGETARDSCTANDPPIAPGFNAWAITVRVLREELIPKKWTRNDAGNYSTVVSPDEAIAIAVVTGDENTGLADAVPTSKYPKGPATQAAVSANERYLFPEMEAIRQAEAAEVEAAEKRITWMLLKRRSDDLVYAELSLPASMTKDGNVEEWLTRIILGPTPIDESGMVVDEDSSEEPIDVPVRRRS